VVAEAAGQPEAVFGGLGALVLVVGDAPGDGAAVKPQYPLVIRLMLAMTLTPDASYCEALARLAGLLAGIPFTLAWHVPTEKVITDWRKPLPAAVMEALFWRTAGPLIGDGEPSAVSPGGGGRAAREAPAPRPVCFPGPPRAWHGQPGQ